MDNKVYLVGAGPGDIELLTIKAVSLLKQADVVVYDSFVDESCFLFCKSYVLRVKVNSDRTQEEVNELLIKHAKSGKTVVRLTSGTPFAFSNGYEEFKALGDTNIEVVVVPGVSSTTSVVESFDIPLTYKKQTISYRTICGEDINLFEQVVTTYNEKENLTITQATQNIKQIVNILLSKNYPYDTPFALLSKGTTLDATIMESSVGQMSEQNEEFYLSLHELEPAVVFIGKRDYDS